MKTYLFIAAAMLLAGCSEKKAASGNDTAESASLAEEKVSEDNSLTKADGGDIDENTTAADSTEGVDAVTSATDVANSPTFNGIIMVSPQQKATLSLTMGGKIHSLSVMPGQYVKKDQVVATIDNPDFIELQHTYLEAMAQVDYLEQEYKRQNSLGDIDVASKKKVQLAKSEYLAMKSHLEAAMARLKTLGVSLDKVMKDGIMTYLPVTAPFTGYATNINVNVGTYLDPGQPVCDIINKSKPLVQLTVYEKDLSLMREGRKMLFRVNGMGNTNFEAEIVAIDQSIDSKDYSIKVYAQVKSEREEFRPGMYVRAKLVEEN